MANDQNPITLSLSGIKRDSTAAPQSRLSLHRDAELTKAVTSKLVEGFYPRLYDDEGRRRKDSPTHNLTQRLTDKAAAATSNAKNMLQVLPDLEMAKQVLIAAILSPHDMMSSTLNFQLPNDDLGAVGPQLLSVIEDYFKNTYKIEALLPKILDDALFMTGSYPLVTLPESSIDEIINSNQRVSVESFIKEFEPTGEPRSYGILGPAKLTESSAKKTVGLESIFGFEAYNTEVVHSLNRNVGESELYLSVTDNPNVLKTPIVKDKYTKEKLAGIYEAHAINAKKRNQAAGPSDKTTDIAMRQLFAQRQYRFNPVHDVKTQDQLEKTTVGHPLVMKVPSESVIPVHVPGDPTNHIGYYLVLDQTGNPINTADAKDYYNELTMNVQAGTDMRNSLLQNARRTQEGVKPTQELEIAELQHLYTSAVEDDLLNRLKNGVYGENVRVSRPSEVYRIMLARSLSRQRTQLLFIPADLMTYIAFEYNDYGQGISLFEKTGIVGAARALLMVANTLAAIKSATNHVNLDIQLDPDDPDPAHTVEMLVHEYVKTRQSAFPFGVTSPADISDFIQASAVGVTVSGNTGYPETKMSVENRASERVQVNTDLDELFKKRQYLGIGLTPEMVDQSMTVDFAQSIIQQNLLMAKRAMIIAKEFCHFIGNDFMQKYILNSKKLMDKLRDAVRAIEAKGTTGVELGNDQTTTAQSITDKEESTDLDRKIDLIVMHFINTFEVTLPEPDMTKVDLQVQAFQKYSEGLDIVIPAFINSAMFTMNEMGELSNSIDWTIAILKAHLQRRWLKQKNVMPELFDIITFADAEKDKFDLLDQHKIYMEGLTQSLLTFMQVALKKKQAMDKIISDANDGEELQETDEAPSSGSGSDDSGGGDSEGGDDFGSFDFDEPPADESTDTETTEESSETTDTADTGGDAAPADDASAE